MAQMGMSKKPRYPWVVHCNIFDEHPTTTHVTSTAPAKTAYAITPTSTATDTMTITSTSTIYPLPVQTTVTTIETDTTTVTSTPVSIVKTTTTTTNTEMAPEATYYAQCAPNNFALQGLNGYLAGQAGGPNADESTVQSIQNSAYDCCVSCAMDPLCFVGVFLQSYGSCFYFETGYGDTCISPSQYQLTIGEVQSQSPPSFKYFNWNCGQISRYKD